MAEGKSKIVFYRNWGKTFNKLTDAEAGKLIKHFCAYINDEDPVLEDRFVEIAWVQIEDTLKRDLKKWTQYIDKQIINGAKGGRPKETQKRVAFIEKPKKGVKVMVMDKVIDNNNNSADDFAKVISSGSHQIWIENLYMKFKLKTGSVGKLLKDFNTHLQIQEKQPKTIKDYKDHFYNWLNTQERVGKLTDYSSKKTGAL